MAPPVGERENDESAGDEVHTQDHVDCEVVLYRVNRKMHLERQVVEALMQFPRIIIRPSVVQLVHTKHNRSTKRKTSNSAPLLAQV